MSPERVDQLLRRASDDVRATVVRHAVPPPIEVLVGHRHPTRRALVGMAAAIATATLGLAILGERSAPEPPTIDAPSPASTIHVQPADADIDDLCPRVVGIAEVLADRPSDTEVWTALGEDLDDLATLLSRSRAGLGDDSTRRYDRFIALAGEAVSLGAQGGYTPAGVRAGDAVAVATDLVEFVAVPGCELDLPRSSDEEEPG